MKNTNKKFVLLCSALIILFGTVALNVSNRIYGAEEELATLRKEVKSISNTLETLEKENKELQQKVNKTKRKLKKIEDGSE